MKFIEELKWRGLLHDTTPGLVEILDSGNPIKGYVGYDPTAPSLTIGNLVTVMLLRILQNHGHLPVVVMGGATGRIGDPSGKSKERQLLDISTIDKNISAQKKVFEKLLDFDNSIDNPAEILDNLDIYKDMGALDFLRDIGKHLTVNYMMSKDSVKSRMETGISFTEFSYQLLQGYDFVWLNKHKGVSLQMGGSDQWGNIVTGIDMISKMYGKKGHGLTCPLLTKSDGSKFGKSEKGNIWLDGTLTTPYEFYQFWLNSSDDDIIKFNRIFTLRSPEEVEELEHMHLADPSKRTLQNVLANDLTLRLHGEEGLDLARKATDFIYGKKTRRDELRLVSQSVYETVASAVETKAIERETIENGVCAIDLLVDRTRIFASKRELRQAIKDNSVSLGRTKLSNEAYLVSVSDFAHGKYLLVEHGKKRQYLITVP